LSDDSPQPDDPRAGLSRRHLVKVAAAGFTLAALPDWFTREARAQEAAAQAAQPRRIGPNDTIQIGAIGLGGSTPGSFRQGLSDTRAVAGQRGTKVVALCDVDARHLAEAKVNHFNDAKTYLDFRELLARPDIDAVVIGTPDHWHGVMAVAALRAGKDVYCEKPLTLTIDEGRKISDTARQMGRVFQTGSQQRSDGRFRLACELVRNGRIGKVKRVEAHLPGAPRGGPFQPQPIPRSFYWDMWLGPAPETEYIKERTHGSFRWWYEYSGGMVTDWGAHHLDISQWGLGTDDTGPVKVEARGEAPKPDPTGRSYNVHPAFDITYTYADGTPLIASNKGENGVRFEGEDGRWIFVSRGKIEASDPKILSDPLPDDRAVKLYVSNNHAGNWVECIRTREQPICNAEIGHRSVSVCHLGTIALRLGADGRALEWDPKRERFRDRAADAMRSRPMRAPWSI
jgi:predicted dehydrogenase